MHTTQEPFIREPRFQPPWYLRSGHLQTLITGFYRPLAPLPPSTTHRCPLPEPKGHVLIHENGPERAGANPQQPAVLLLHGLGSSHTGTYMTNIAWGLLQRGYRVFRADLPGAGRSYLETPLPPHGACYPEIRACVDHLSGILSISAWYIVGVSLGGNILLRMLADPGRSTHSKETELGDPSEAWASRNKVLRAIAIAPPIDLHRSCCNVEKGVNRFYATYFLRAIRSQAIKRAEHWPRWKELLDKADFRTLRRFDNSVTAPLAGFRDSDEYYATGSSMPWLSTVEQPVKILIDRHDPIVPFEMFPDANFGPRTECIITERGGHVGYLRKNLLRKESASPNDRKFQRWADHWIVETLLDDQQWEQA